jgi:two-component system phosphate regulon sensor histidine kinase PhoR
LSPLKSPYFWRAFAVYSLFALPGLLIFALLQLGHISGSQRDFSLSGLRQTADVLATALRPVLREGELAELQDVTARISDATGFDIHVISTDGSVLSGSFSSPDGNDNLLHRPEVQLAIASGQGEAVRFSQVLGSDYTFHARSVADGNVVLGVVRLARNDALLEDRIWQLQKQLLGYLGGVAFILLVAAVAIASLRARTLDIITLATETIAQGNFDSRVAESRARGMKRMADAVNMMARNSARRVSMLTADRNRLASIFTGMVEGVIDIDQSQNIIHINEAAAHLLAINAEKCSGKPFWQEIRHKSITQALDDAIKGRTVIKTTVEFQREKDALVIELYVASLSDDQGLPIGAVMVLHDVTELKHLERIRTDFVANASHELKTPITAIRGLSETVMDDPDVEKSTLLQFMGRIYAQSIRLSQLVGDLMTISRLEADQGVEEFTHINFSDLVQRAVEAVESLLHSKHHTLTTDLGDVKVDVYGDRQNLSQLVDNLIDNAIKYTPEGGRIQVRLRVEKHEVVLEVQDTGIGISPQYQERVFERFYRVDKARSQSLGGTGLGLSIVRNIAEKHGGSVSVRSQLGVGSTFSFRMPLA